MNQVIETIRKRRSVRAYDPRPIPRDILNTILECGNAAPTGAGSRAWRFVVVQDESFRKKLAALAAPRYRKWLESMPESFKQLRMNVDKENPDPAYYSAPAIVFVIGGGGTSPLDCPMVCQNMMLAARSMDIGSCWVYIGQLVCDVPEVKEALELKEGEKVYGPIILGYPRGGFPEKAGVQPVVKWI
jgi:nitroreductase